MLKQTTPDLLVGDLAACTYRRSSDRLMTIHACKVPCFMNASLAGEPIEGGATINGRVVPLVLMDAARQHLYLNLIDPPVPLFRIESFQWAITFAEMAATAGRVLLVHCNQGKSRAPSIALVILAKRGVIASGTYDDAAQDFTERFFPAYAPGAGISTFLRREWEEL